MRVTITDATASGRETARMLLNDVPNPILLRDLIRHRVREEVARFNARPSPHFNGLVQPTDSERTLNGYALRRPRRLDPEAQAKIALDAFTRNGFFVFVGDRQVDDLDEELTLADTDVVSFVRLVPLVGG
jgi:hypothetical protein